MSQALKIDFVSDVSCPWCVIGLKALEQALENQRETLTAEIHFQPFELNPQMPPEGQDLNEHLVQKYGGTVEQFVTFVREETAKWAKVIKAGNIQPE